MEHKAEQCQTQIVTEQYRHVRVSASSPNERRCRTPDWQSGPDSVLNLSPTGDSQKAGNTKRISIPVRNFRGIVRRQCPSGCECTTTLNFLEALIMKHRNIHSKADRVQLKQKFDRQPPSRREAGISIRKTVKAFIYDVFEDGYLIRQLTKGK